MNILLKFKFPVDLTVEQVITQLSSEIGTQLVSKQHRLKTYYDSFDWRLYDSGIICEVVQSETSTVFMLKTIENDWVIAETDLNEVPRFSQQFKHELIRNTLVPILEMRALLPICTVEYNFHKLNIINEDKKTLLRLFIEEYEQFNHCVSMHSLKGYDKAAETVIEILTVQLGVIASTEPVLLAALQQQGRRPNDYSPKLAIHLNPDMRADVASKLIYSQLLKTIKANEQGTIADTDSEFLHDFRVAVRKTRTALSQLKNVLPDDINAHYAGFFSWLGQITSQTRDLDVYLLNFAYYKSGLPSGIREHIDPLHDFLLKKQQQAQQELATKLRSAEYLMPLAAWEQYLNEPMPITPDASNALLTIKQLADKRLRKSYRRVLHEGEAITDKSPCEALHDLRKSCKKLRYLMEFFQSLYEKNKIKTLINVLKGLQEVLGDFQDCAVQEWSLKQFSEEMRGMNTPTNTFLAIGSVIQNLDTHKHQIRHHFAVKFAEFKQEDIKSLFE